MANRTRFVAFVTGFTLLASSALAGQWPVAEMNKTVDQTNFVINGICSGTLISIKQRFILTAKHCIEAQYEVVKRERYKDDGSVVEEKVRRALPGRAAQLTFNGGMQVQSATYRTKIILTDDEKDLALVQIISDKIPNTIAAVIACENPVRGERIYIVGNPYSILYSTVHEGIVSSVQRDYPLLGVDDQGDAELMQISGGTIGGTSGGAVYNDVGHLVGVPVRASRINEMVGFATPLVDVKRFLRRAGLEADLWLDRCEKK